ncbi:vacuolar protein sorting-associated protein 9A isoform X2 [Musa acuminata AAA Group]|uniref:vacuolar protein sorting-associated protein 9A isoform X2 n=1 Tax=Musa acuminata AAA Group TaxID=214697 RepID=UPI0031D98E9D
MEPSHVSHPNFYDFLNRMRRPAAADLVRSIKSFVISFPFQTSNAEHDGNKVQDFLTIMETTIKEHPLWAHATYEEIDSAIEGLEKYIMTKLFTHTFASSSEDAKLDLEISEKICLLQHFIKPDHLDVPRVFQNEASWLANPPQLHSNLKFVQLYRKHSKLVSEVEYYLTNLISAKTFITNINASSLSMDESEFHRNMQLARLASEITVNEPSGTFQLSEGSPPIVRNKYIYVEGNGYPFMEAEARDLRLEDVQQLLGLYKQVVTKYRKLSEALRQLSIDENQLLNNHQRQDMKEKIEQQLEQAGNSGGTR